MNNSIATPSKRVQYNTESSSRGEGDGEGVGCWDRFSLSSDLFLRALQPMARMRPKNVPPPAWSFFFIPFATMALGGHRSNPSATQLRRLTADRQLHKACLTIRRYQECVNQRALINFYLVFWYWEVTETRYDHMCKGNRASKNPRPKV